MNERTGAPIMYPGTHDSRQREGDAVQPVMHPGDYCVFNSTLGHHGVATQAKRPLVFMAYHSRKRTRIRSAALREDSGEGGEMGRVLYDKDDRRFNMVFKNNVRY